MSEPKTAEVKVVPVEPTIQQLNEGWRELSANQGYTQDDLNQIELAPVYRAMLAAAPPAQSGWRTMESAPKDGTEVLVMLRPKVIRLGWYFKPSSRSEGWLDESGNNIKPTHWMPLPEDPGSVPASPPAEKGEGFTANDIAAILEQNADADAEGLHNASQLAQKIYLLARAQPVSPSEGEAVAWVCPKQLADHTDYPPEDLPCAGRQMPVRKSRAGKFTQPLYTHPASDQSDTERMRAALLENMDKLWIARCDSRDEKFRAVAERAVEMGKAALAEKAADQSAANGEA